LGFSRELDKGFSRELDKGTVYLTGIAPNSARTGN
jgi:hypothetical protein